MAAKLITAPTSEPLTLIEAKSHLRVDGTEDDSLITSLIVSARSEAEKITRRALITQTWELILDRFPPVIELPFPPLQSVISVKYIDDGGTEVTLSGSVYTVDTDSSTGRVVPAYLQVWPMTRNQINAVRVRYVTGYGTADKVPIPIKQWMLIRIATMYENREAITTGNVNAIPFVDGLLDEYRVVSF